MGNRTRLAILTLALAATAQADWLGFRNRDAVALDARPPLTWSSAKNLKWKATLPGPGSSSPIVVGNHVFVTCYTGDAPANVVHHLVRLDRATGKIAWTAAVPAGSGEDSPRGYLTEHGYASSTPVSDGKAVYAFFGKAGVVAFDLSGGELWRANVGRESDEKRWGSGASPILHDGKVIVNAARESRSLVALDCKSGKEVWKAEGARLELSFGTPAVVRSASGREEIVVSCPGEVWGVNPANGKLRWLASTRSEGNVSPSVVVGDGVVYVTGGFTNKGTTAIRAGGSRDVTKSHVEWSIAPSSYVPTPLLLDGRLHWVSEDGVAFAIDAKTGNVLYQQRLGGVAKGHGRPVYASLVATNGRLYAVTRRAGVYVLEAGASFRQLARNEPLDDTDFNATPALDGRQLFLRSNKGVYCLEESGKE